MKQSIAKGGFGAAKGGFGAAKWDRMLFKGTRSAGRKQMALFT